MTLTDNKANKKSHHYSSYEAKKQTAHFSITGEFHSRIFYQFYFFLLFVFMKLKTVQHRKQKTSTKVDQLSLPNYWNDKCDFEYSTSLVEELKTSQ